MGANLIARTARATLGLLQEVRSSQHAIPLAWEKGIPGELKAIEVYPAATRISLKLDDGHEGASDKPKLRAAILNRLEKDHKVLFHTDVNQQKIIGIDHIFDAVLCAVAAREFLAGNVDEPTVAQLSTAKKEGWIWVKAP